MKLKKRLMINYFIATLLTLTLVGFAVLKGIEKFTFNIMEQQLIDQS